MTASEPIQYRFSTFHQLSNEELYEILAFRAEVFVVEQNCPYQDPDGQDEKAIHLQQLSGNRLVGYARLFQGNKYHILGRVLIREKERSKGLGHQLMDAALRYITIECPSKPIKISAQLHLEKFYNSHDFKAVGESYLEDGIPHIAMIRQPD